MGLLSFLSSLVNGDHEDKDETNGQVPHSWSQDADGYLVPHFGQGAQIAAAQAPSPVAPINPPQDPYYTASAAPMAAPQSPSPVGPAATDEQEITVSGDPWKPHKGTVLGAIADAIASYTDDGTPFADARDKRNLMEASEGMTSHPMDAIRRIAKVDPKKAWELLNQAQDNTRQQGSLDRQNRMLDLQNENLLFTRSAGMMRAATPTNWQAMREQALKFGQARGMDLSPYIPEQYDPDAVSYIAAGAIPPAKQVQLEETGRHNKATESIGQQNADTRSRYTDAAIQQGDARIGIGQQNADTGLMNAETSAAREGKMPNKGPGTPIQTKYGPAVISADGTTMTMYPHDEVAPQGYDGKGIKYIRVKDKWVPANTRAKQ